MSRSHMLYDDKQLANLPVQIKQATGSWTEDKIFKKKSGNGLIIEGSVSRKSRYTIVDRCNSSQKFRYLILHIVIKKATKRKFGKDEKEIEPDFGDKKKVNTGYLSSSYKCVSREGVDVIRPEHIVEMLKNDTLDKLVEDKGDDTVDIWCCEDAMKNIEIENKQDVRLRTVGDGPFLESIICLQTGGTKENKLNLTSEGSVGWTERVLEVRDEKKEGHHLTEDNDAIEDDEWDD